MTKAPTRRRVIVSFAVLAGIVVVASFMAIQLAPRRGAPDVAVAVSPSPVALDHGPPPPGVPLIWVQDPNHAGWLVGFDWTGKPRSTVKLTQPLGEAEFLTQASDGSKFADASGGKGGYSQFLDQLGHPLAGMDSTVRHESQMWADDSVHMCTLDTSGGLDTQWKIGLVLPGTASTTFSVVALDSTNLGSGIIAISLAACSARNDRAVITYNYSGRPSEFWIVRISDGAIVAHHAYATDQLANVAVSPDATLIAENSGRSAGQIAPGAASTVIRRASDMSVLTTLDPSTGVLGFNSDDSIALVALTPWASGVATDLAAIDTQTGKMIWRSKWNEELSTFVAEPAGTDFALMLQAPGDTSIHASVNVVIVHATTSETDIPGRYPLL